ncbi:lipoate--protein ligase family protein [candidate division KSB1 bacterium]|nr:lipoate--protein ligase family protein [candidate division KSB1 bacterium]
MQVSPASQWWLLDSGANDASWNMATDHYLAVEAKLDRPLLRFYTWRPAAISLGYNQHAEDLDLARCSADGLTVVRRPTGGRAVLHAEELTYAVIIPKSAHTWYRGNILETYQFISVALVAGLKKLGLDVQFEPRRTGNLAYAARNVAAVPCFSASAQYEILSAGKKLVGSAQRRFEQGILQHGSILMGTYHLRLPFYLRLPQIAEQPRLVQMLAAKTTSISQISAHPIRYDEVLQAMVAGFIEKYTISFIPKQLTAPELREIEALTKKYPKIVEVNP